MSKLEDRIFVCCWNTREYPKPTSEEVGIDYFTDDIGFDEEDRKLIESLEVSGVSTHGLVGGLKIVRIA